VGKIDDVHTCIKLGAPDIEKYQLYECSEANYLCFTPGTYT
jgi:hypothetical protein